MTHDFSLREAKARLSHLLDLAAGGAEIEIRRGGAKRDRFRIVPVETGDVLRRPGTLKGRIVVEDDFDAEDPGLTGSFET